MFFVYYNVSVSAKIFITDTDAINLNENIIVSGMLYINSVFPPEPLPVQHMLFDFFLINRSHFAVFHHDISVDQNGFPHVFLECHRKYEITDEGITGVGESGLMITISAFL